MLHRTTLLIIFLCFANAITNAQTIAVGSIRLEEAMRDLQLLNKIPQNYSFSNRGYNTHKKMTLDSLLRWMDEEHFNNNKFNHHLINKKWSSLTLLPLELKQQFNSKTPFGYNDGSFIKAKGYQSDLSVGFFARFGPLQIQLQPNITYSENKPYAYTSNFGTPTKGKILRAYPGQSEVSLNLNAVSVGISSANAWLGPGIKNSLLMSNNAPGFYNAFFKTKRPLATPIGSFEWSLMTGWLREDSMYAFENYKMKPFSNRNRRMLYNGLTITHQPRWFKGLHIGLIRAYNTKNASNFKSDVFRNSSFIDKYLPVFTVLTKSKIINIEDQKERDQQASIFIRWVSPKDHFEWYVEYGWNDHKVNMRDLVMGPGHSAAYLTGLKKIVPLKKKNEYFNVELEYMRGQQLAEHLVRDAGNWNWHGDLQSFTNNNQYLGSAIGGGSNSIHLLSSYHKGWKRYALSFERIFNDPLYFPNNKWIDFATGLAVDHMMNKLLIQSQIKWVQQKNFGWQQENNVGNIFASVGLKYLF